MSLAPLMGLPGKVKTLLDRLTATRAGNLDNLNTPVSSRAAAATALSTANWTNTRAGNLDRLDTTVASRAAQSSVDTLLTRVPSIIPMSPIASIQRGTVVINFDAVTVTISSVDMGKSFLLFSVDSESATSTADELADKFYIRGKIDTPTQLRFDRRGSSGSVAINWQVVEHV